MSDHEIFESKLEQESPKNNENELTLELLENKLGTAGIDTSKWGTKKAKTILHLLKEIQLGETVMGSDHENEILRKVVVVGGYVFYRSPEGKNFRLVEQKQVFNDGRERIRNLNHAVSEKTTIGEDPRLAIVRGIKEELGIEGELKIKDGSSKKNIRKSTSYPGLNSEYTIFNFKVMLTDEQYKPEGYIEVQEDKRTYFVWKEIEK